MLKRTRGEKIFSIFNYIFMIGMMIIMLYPLYYIVICSFSEGNALVGQKGLMLLPKGFNMGAYRQVVANPNILTGYKTTIILVVAGTALNVLVSSLTAYVLSQPKFAIKKVMLMMIVLTMFFSGGLIPRYLLIYKTLGLRNNMLALILPTAISTWNLMIMKSNFESIPGSLIESVKIDGGNDFTILFKIVMPLSMPVIAVMILFYGVAHWNNWFDASLFMRDRSKYPLSLIMREILILSSMDDMMGGVASEEKYSIGKSLQYATIVVSTLPILAVYPFLQKYFVKGMMIGAVKG